MNGVCHSAAGILKKGLFSLIRGGVRAANYACDSISNFERNSHRDFIELRLFRNGKAEVLHFQHKQGLVITQAKKIHRLCGFDFVFHLCLVKEAVLIVFQDLPIGAKSELKIAFPDNSHAGVPAFMC